MALLAVGLIQLSSALSLFWYSGRSIVAMLLTAEQLDDDEQKRHETEQRLKQTHELIDQLETRSGYNSHNTQNPAINPNQPTPLHPENGAVDTTGSGGSDVQGVHRTHHHHNSSVSQSP